MENISKTSKLEDSNQTKALVVLQNQSNVLLQDLFGLVLR